MKIVVALLAALILAAPAGAATRSYIPADPATAVAQVFAQRTDVEVRCFDPDEQYSPASLGAWGYTIPLQTPVMFLDGPTICAGLAAVASDDPAVPDWVKALSVLVLVHESYHLRVWKWRMDEGKVECQAIRHWRYGVRMLGATTAVADRLFPWALEAHWHLAAIAPQYRWTYCQVPGP